MRFITFCTLLSINIPTSMANDVNDLYISEEHEAYSQTANSLYVGTSLGWSDFQDACGLAESDCTNDVLSYGVYAGYQFNAYFALEAGLHSFSQLGANYLDSNSSVDIWGGDIAMVFTLPVSNQVSLYSKLGGAYFDIDKEVDSTDFASTHGWDVLAALGMNYRFSQNWALRGEYSFIDGVGNTSTGQADLHSLTLGLTYHFSPAIPVVVATQSAVETGEFKENEPQDALSEPQDQVFQIEQLFDFDSTELKYNSALKKYASQLTYLPNSKIKITGFTDSLGTTAYNQRLSELRAQAVAEYFKRMGVSHSRIEVIGLGEKNFKATNDTEYGRAQNRRVEISVAPQDQSNN